MPIRETTAGETHIEQRFRQLAANLADFVVIIDHEPRYRWVNRVAPGLRMEQVLGWRSISLLLIGLSASWRSSVVFRPVST